MRNLGSSSLVSTSYYSGVFSTKSNDSNAKTTYMAVLNSTSISSSVTGDTVSFDYTPEATISETGSGEEYMPLYMTVYCWQRTA